MAARRERFERFLADALASFAVRHETEVTKLPRVVRALKMGEFADLYGGDVRACAAALAQRRIKETDEEVEALVRKRCAKLF